MGPKLPYLGIFGLEFEKAIVISQINPFEFMKNEFLTIIVDLGIGSAFSEVPDPGLVPLCKVCCLIQILAKM